jgi:transcriptional regulator with XRE-family HTH domain
MINQALRLLRVFNDIKSKEMALSLDISPSYLSEIENGKKVPSLTLINKYAKIFETTPSSILFFSEKIEKEGPNHFKSLIAKKTIDFLMSIESENTKEIST